MKVCFIYPGWSNEKTLSLYKKMTPGSSGVWKDMVGVTSIEEADYCVIIDYTEQKVPPEKAIYVGAHPYMPRYSGYHNFDSKDCVAKLDLQYTFGFGEWWLKYGYDYLSKLEPVEKTKNICCIMSNNEGIYGQLQRKIFIRQFSKRTNVHIYGRIKDIGNGVLGSIDTDGGNHTHVKEPILGENRYSIEVDVGFTKHYFSERVFDSLLMWCMPLYWGSTNVEDYLPENSFRYINIYGDGSDILKIVENGEREKNLSSIAEARHLLLNKYQIWARIWELINSL